MIPCPRERDEQVTLIAWFRQFGWSMLGLQSPDLLIAIPNGGKRALHTAARLRAEGVVAGTPDLLLAVKSGEYGGLWIEMKRRFGGKVSERQKAMHNLLSAQGYAVAVCAGFQAAREAIASYLNVGLPSY